MVLAATLGFRLYTLPLGPGLPPIKSVEHIFGQMSEEPGCDHSHGLVCPVHEKEALDEQSEPSPRSVLGSG